MVINNYSESYVNKRGLDIKKTSYNTLLRFENIPSIANDKNVVDVYVENTKKSIDINKKDYISLPTFIYNNYSDIIGLKNLLTISEGRIPQDNKNEIVLSKNLLLENKIEYSKNTIGSVITLKNKTYKIVGISSIDLYWVSYDKNDLDNFYYCYNQKTFNQFQSESLKHHEEVEYYHTYEIDTVFITTKKGQEQKVLDSLMIKYPANDYFSSQYDKITTSAKNQKLIQKILLFDLGFLCIGIVILMFIQNIIYTDDLLLIEDYKNYYFIAHLTRFYDRFKIILKLALTAILAIIGYYFSGVYWINVLIVSAMSLLIILSVDIIYGYILRKKEL